MVNPLNIALLLLFIEQFHHLTYLLKCTLYVIVGCFKLISEDWKKIKFILCNRALHLLVVVCQTEASPHFYLPLYHQV